ncbi:MAG: hypothetical protein ACO1O1_16005 [Adhaeribacter sp.]
MHVFIFKKIKNMDPGLINNFKTFLSGNIPGTFGRLPPGGGKPQVLAANPFPANQATPLPHFNGLNLYLEKSNFGLCRSLSPGQHPSG